jgi:hypothetical protein
MNLTQTTTQTAKADSDYLKRPDISVLNSNYTDADSVDQPIFSEMRSNVLLCAGDHYNNRQSRFYKRLRDNRDISQEQKLRLTKNHTRKICQTYSNIIVSANPGVGFSPKDETSNHDQKMAELHHAVWRDAHERYNMDDKIDDYADSFVQIGEVAVKIFYDPQQGAFKGYEPQVDPTTGEHMIDEENDYVADESKPIFEGAFVFEEIYGFNLLRPSDCKDMRKAEWLGIRKMMNKDELLRKYKNDPKMQAKIKSDQDETYTIFDPVGGGYKKTSNQTMIREFYYRPSLLFPNGYFYINTHEAILAEGELPGGLFPIVFAAFDKIPTTPRGRSPVKTMRPYQAEINRAASKMAEHQITLGDDKLLLQNGTKASAGASLPGVRTINYTGSEPKILAGRAGDQYLKYMNDQILEMYNVLMVNEQEIDKDTKADPFILIYQSARNKKRFQRYIKRFEKFLIEFVQLYLELAKIHLPDEAVIMAVGKNEQINLEEYRKLPKTCYEIKIEAQADDVESKLGKQMVLNHTLQYAGSSMKPEDIGKILRQMPYANFEEDFDDLTIDYDSAKNDMLALDRGEKPAVGQYDNHPYMIKRLTARTRKPDFKFLGPEIQQNYLAKIDLHQQFEAANQAAIQRAEAGFIPVGGALITVDFYMEAPNSTGGAKTVKAKLPYQAVEWLVQKLTEQGASQDQLVAMTSGNQAQIGAHVSQMNPIVNQPEAGTQSGQPSQSSPWAM